MTESGEKGDASGEGRITIGAEIRCAPRTVLSDAEWQEVLQLLDIASTPASLRQYAVARSDSVSRRREFAGLPTLKRILRRSDVRDVFLSIEGASAAVPSSHYSNWVEGALCFAHVSGASELQSINWRRYVPDNEGDWLAVRAAIQSLFTLCRGVCGQMHSAREISYVRNETSSLCSWPWKPRIPNEDTEARVVQLKPYRAANDPRVFGAYWGTFLNAEQVEALGGVRQVLATAPVAHTEVLEGGAMYLQLTDTPEPITTPRMRAALPLLEAYLAPISVPVRYFTAP